MNRRGLRAQILRGTYNCGRGGYSSGPDIHDVYIVGPGVTTTHPIPDGAPILILAETLPGYTVARPEQGGGWQAGGSYVAHDGTFSAWETTFGHHLPIPLHDRNEQYINLQYLGPGTLFRGAHKLPHQSQILRRDFEGEQIQKARGEVAQGYVRPVETDANREWLERAWWGNQFIVKAPGSITTAWTAFRERHELERFVAAYALEFAGSLEPGGEFTLTTPDWAFQWLKPRAVVEVSG